MQYVAFRIRLLSFNMMSSRLIRMVATLYSFLGLSNTLLCEQTAVCPVNSWWMFVLFLLFGYCDIMLLCLQVFIKVYILSSLGCGIAGNSVFNILRNC